MTRKLVLHIGAHRTATTAIQKTLRSNFEVLLRQGVLYPFGVNKHFGIFHRLFAGRLDPAELAADITGRADSKPHEIHTVILSDEAVCKRPDLSILAPLRDHFDVKVVYGLRRQDLWLESWYLQNVKGQWDADFAHLSFDDFMGRWRADAFHWIDYDRYARHLDEVFGAENVRLHVFEKHAMPDGAIARFCELAGIPDFGALELPTVTNPSLDPLTTEFMRRLPLDSAKPAYKQALIRAFTTVSDGLQRDGRIPSLLLTPARRAEVLDRYAEGNAALAQRRFGRAALFLDPLPEADLPVADMQLPEDGQRVMERFIQPFVSALIEQNR